jgi:competence protein ComEC
MPALLVLALLGCGAWAGRPAERQTLPATVVAKAPELRVDFIDVGHGDAILITSPAGKTVLVDGGGREAGARVATFVRARTRQPIDLVMLTHRHADHLGGLAEVVTRQGARAFMDAPFPHPSPAYDHLIQVLEQARVPVREAVRGREIDLGGGARLVLLTPPTPVITGSRSDANANSLVARLELGGVRMLLTGDAEAVTERWLVETNAGLRADVLKLSHHGSKYSSTATFLRAVSPRIAVATAGPGDRTGTLQPETEARVAAVAARLYRTDRDGNITLWTDGHGVRVEVEHQSQRAEREAVP